MAYKTTKIKSGMTLPKLAEQYGTTPAAILQANKIPKLSAGMVVKIPPPPKPINSFGLQYNSPVGPVQPPVQQYGQPIGPVQTQTPYGPFQPAPLTQGSFVSGSGQVNLQGQVMGGRGTIPTTADRINAAVQQQSATPLVPVRPQGVYTGDPSNNPNDAAWVNYWNQQAANPGPKAPPVVMTKDQIWNMKANARRRKQQEREQDDNSRQYQEQMAAPVKYQPFLNIGNATNQNATWRV